MQERTLHDIEQDALSAGIGIGAVCRAANMSDRNFYYLKTGQQTARSGTLRRLDIGLSRAKMAQKLGAGGASERSVYMLCVYAVAQFMRVSADVVLSHDPAKRATSDVEWMAASKVRRLALYVASVATGMKQAEVARAAGMTRAAVCIALKQIEDDRDDAVLDAFLTSLEKVFSA